MIEYRAVNIPVLESVPNMAYSILDVGCGTGNLGTALKEQNKDRYVCGLTYSNEEANTAKKVLDAVLVADLNNPGKIEINRTFDCIIFSHVLEHTFYPAAVLRHFKTYLAQGGTIIAALPNIMHFRQRKEFLKGNFEYSEEGGLMDATHFRFFDWKNAQKLITDAGLVLVSKKATGSFPLSFIRKILPDSFARKIDNAAVEKWPGLFGFQFIFIAKTVN